MKEKDRYITVQHAAERLSVTERHIYFLIQERALEAIRVGPRAIRISERSLEEFIELQRVDPEEYAPADVSPQPPRPPARSRWMNK